MIARADAILAVIPLLAVSGLVLRTLVVVSGVGTWLLALPLVPGGVTAAAAVIARECLTGRVADDGRA